MDSWAWVEYLLSSDSGRKVKEIIDDENYNVFTHVLSLAEISSRLSRAGSEHQRHIDSIVEVSEIIGVEFSISPRAGNLHAEIRKKISDFGLVDAFILLAAQENGMKILTGDKHFKGMKEAVLI